MKKAEPFDKDLIRELADLLTETGLNEIEVEQDGRRVRVARGTSRQHFVPSSSDAPAPQPPPTDSAPAAERAGTLNSPMVGTAYLAPEPGAAPFVTVGASVAIGQTVLIIEAMKTMNHIAAPRAGVVTAVFVEDGQPVEFGEGLLCIE